MKKIKVDNTLVTLHGDEMAQVAFDAILDRFVKNNLDVNLYEIDLSAKNRLRTNGAVVNEAIDALKAYGVGIKNAGVTVNAKQLDQLIKELAKEEGLKLNKNSLNKLATKSPNGTIRKGIHGNITREDIPFTNLCQIVPNWRGQNIEVETMDSGGLLNSFNQASQVSGVLRLTFTDSKGISQVLHSRPIDYGDPYLFCSNDLYQVKSWAENLFARAVKEGRDVYVGLKDTVMPGYDGVMRQCIEEVFHTEYEGLFKSKGLKYEYGLIDAQAAKMVVSPPANALWGIPDNTSGRKLYKLVEKLKEHGIPQRSHKTAISRMSAGGGDQYGSFNAAAPDDGVITLTIGKRTLHARDLKKGDPMLLMSNHQDAIRDWVEQTFNDSRKKDQEIYFGLKREYMEYDAKFSDIINEVRDALADDGSTPPSIMMMTPSKQLIKMICDPPGNARYAALNLDGDIFSDITAALGGSLATASSVITSKAGTLLFEAPHGTAPDLYETYLQSKGKEVYFNPSALLYAVANALESIAERETNKQLLVYSNALKEALIATVEEGVITPDIRGRTLDSDNEKVVDMPQFIETIDNHLQMILKNKLRTN